VDKELVITKEHIRNFKQFIEPKTFDRAGIVIRGRGKTALLEFFGEDPTNGWRTSSKLSATAVKRR